MSTFDWLLAGLAVIALAVVWLRGTDRLTVAIEERDEARDRVEGLEVEISDAEEATEAAVLRATEAETELADAQRPVLTIVPRESYSEEELTTLQENACVHCGGSHAVACPRVKRLRFRADGETVLEVEFWPDAEWPKERIIWVEDLPAPETT